MMGMSECIDHGQKGSADGYGRSRYKGKTTGSHRSAYCKHHHLELGSIDGLVVRHKCNNPRCINPEHLKLGTASDNMQDRERSKNHVRGTQNPQAKLTEAEVLSIRERYKAGETQVSIAKSFGVRQGYISNIINGRIWRE